MNSSDYSSVMVNSCTTKNLDGILRSQSMGQSTAGITVNGGQSNQRFVEVADFECEASDVIILHLIGKIDAKPIEKPITVDFKPQCDSCGKLNKATNKFCSECGTSLVLFK
jgi:hypothetical protein